MLFVVVVAIKYFHILEGLHCAWTFLRVPTPVLFVAHGQLLVVVDNFQKAFRDRLLRVKIKI